MRYTQLWNKEFIKNTIFLDPHSIQYAIELGSFQGLTSNYIVDNLLAWNGNLVCIDPLDSDYQLDNEPELFINQYEYFIENTEHNKDKITLIRKKTQDILPYMRSDSADFVYVDAHHTEPAVYFDGTESFRILKTGGYLLFDDYLYGNNFEMKKGIDRFLAENPNHKLLLRLNQVLIQKLPEGSPTEDGTDRYQELTCEKLYNKDTIYAAYANLDERKDREEKMQVEIARVDFEIPIVRQRSFPWKELYDSYDDAMKERVNVMFKRTPGAIGCHFSQVEIMKTALSQGKHAIVLEDDIQFCADFPKRWKIILKFINQHEWDCVYFGGTWHKEPTWHKSIEGTHTHPDMKAHCGCLLNRDWEETLNPRIVRTYGAFSTHAYMVNKDRIQHVLNLLDRNLHLSMGIDWIMLKEQPAMNCYAFTPGCIKQYDGKSNIGDGISRFSGFAALGEHWFSQDMNIYIPD